MAELGDLLSQVNGFTVFNAGIQVFRAGPEGLGPELRQWNDPTTWKHTYGTIVDGLFCFAQDLFGVQFAVIDNEHIIRFDPETAERSVLGTTLDDWAAWLLAEPDVHGADSFARAWQDHHGPLDHNERLVSRRLFVFGGTYDFDNLLAKDAAECMRIRGPLAQQVHNLPSGAHVQLTPATPAGDDPGLLTYAEGEVFADYNSFFVQDEHVRVGKEDWVDEVIANMVAARPGVVMVGTLRRMTVPVTIEARRSEPTDSFDGWDHVTEASLTTDGAVVATPPYEHQDKISLTIPAGTYRVRVYYAGFGTLSEDGLEGDDHYRIVLWPGTEREAAVLKRYPGPIPWGG